MAFATLSPSELDGLRHQAHRLVEWLSAPTPPARGVLVAWVANFAKLVGPPSGAPRRRSRRNSRGAGK